MASLTNFGSDVVERVLEPGVPRSTSLPLHDIYEFQSCVDWIQAGGYEKVCLQFPDELLGDAATVARTLTQHLGRTVYILGDTTYGSCCVDEVAAEHIGADAVIHFGRTCLSPSRRLPVLYILTRLPVDVDKVTTGLSAAVEDKTQPLILVYDTRCYYAVDDITGRLREMFPRLVTSALMPDEITRHTAHSDTDKQHKGCCGTKVDGCCSEESTSKNMEQKCTDKTTKLNRNPSVENAHSVLKCGGKCTEGKVERDAQNDGISVRISADSTAINKRVTENATIISECVGEKADQSDVTLGKDNAKDATGTVDSACVVEKSDKNDLILVKENINSIVNESVVGGYKKVAFNGRCVILPKGANIKDYKFVYVGPSGPTLTTLSMRFSENLFYHVEAETGCVLETSGMHAVMSRSAKLEMARDAQIIGILVGTLGVANYRDVISRLKTIIKSAGKRSYTFAVGKPNEPKLANISEVDVFVYVACPETSIIERETDPALYRKIITPWELEVALLPDQEWDLAFQCDFRELLPGGKRHVPASGEVRMEEASVSLLTNKTQRLGVREDDKLDSRTGAVVLQDGRTVARLHSGGGGEVLVSRTWAGLDPSLPAPHATGVVVEGKTGIAAGYSHEK